MKFTILTDLISGHKKATLNFIQSLPLEMDITINLVNIIEPSFGGDSLLLNLSDLFKNEASESLKNLGTEISAMVPDHINVQTHCLVGTFKNKLILFLEEEPTDLLVMFGRTKSGIEKLLTQKKSLQILGRIQTPTLIIPAHFESLNFEKFGTAVHEKEQITEESIQHIQEIVRFFHADAIVFHVDDLSEDDLDYYEHNKELNRIATQELAIVRDLDIHNGIETAIKEHNIDVLIGITHKKGWLENLMQGNTIATILINNEHPLLIISK